MLVALSGISSIGVGVGKRPELVLIQLPNLIGIVLLLSSNDLLVTVTGWE